MHTKIRLFLNPLNSKHPLKILLFVKVHGEDCFQFGDMLGGQISHEMQEIVEQVLYSIV